MRERAHLLDGKLIEGEDFPVYDHKEGFKGRVQK
jgi:hypothetical protein